MKLSSVIVFLCFLMAHMSATKKSRLLRGVRWWALANVPQPQNTLLNPSSTVLFNPSLQPLSRKQRKLVAENQGTIIAIAKGASLAVEECQHQFKNRKWNCPTSDDSHGGNIFGKIMLKGCRETSFIYSITSAAVTYQLARACAEGIISTCTCDYRQQRYPSVDPSGKPWEWGGCSDNMEFGLQFGKSFTDGVEKGRDLRYIMNRHNNGAGRLQVQNQMVRDCKCHGMSGSCTVKTCWMRLPKFRAVGDLIKGRFDGASRVYQGNSGRGRGRKPNLLPVNVNHKAPSKKDLVYYEDSPSFCEYDPSTGFQGTTGRECNATSIGVDGCDLLCCGRGHKSESYISQERCSCTFHWCCRVHCEICTRVKIRHTCK